jgi:hypothetical protein
MQSFLRDIEAIAQNDNIGGVDMERGSERNVLVKFLVPLLRFLGYDIVRDVDFEYRRMDAVVHATDHRSTPFFIVETKSWDNGVARRTYLRQCLRYAWTLHKPYVLMTCGRCTSLHSALLGDTAFVESPLVSIGFDDLRTKQGQKKLRRLYRFLAKPSFLRGEHELKKVLPRGVSYRRAWRVFESRCRAYRAPKAAPRIDAVRFRELASRHPEKIRKALMLSWNTFQKMSRNDSNVDIRPTLKEVGLRYYWKPADESRSLIGLSPIKHKVYCGVERNWSRVLPRDLMKRLESWHGRLVMGNEADARAYLRRLKEAVTYLAHHQR